MTDAGDHTERVRSYFDSHAEDWSRAYRQPRSANDVVLGERLRLALTLTEDVASDASALDAGCGAGLLTVALARRGYHVTAVDLSPRMVELCRDALHGAGVDEKSVHVACGDSLQMELGSGPFDVIYALGFLQYQEDERATLKRLRGLLRPGGRLVISGPISRRVGNLFGVWNLVRNARRRVEVALGRGDWKELEQLLAISNHTYSIGRLRRLLDDAGFETLAFRPHGFVNYAVIGPVIGVEGELTLNRLFSRLAKWTPISRFANDLVALAARPGS